MTHDIVRTITAQLTKSPIPDRLNEQMNADQLASKLEEYVRYVGLDTNTDNKFFAVVLLNDETAAVAHIYFSYDDDCYDVSYYDKYGYIRSSVHSRFDDCISELITRGTTLTEGE